MFDSTHTGATLRKRAREWFNLIRYILDSGEMFYGVYRKMDIGGEVNLELPFKKKINLERQGNQGASVSGLRYPRHRI
jgi:hypothetical protein